MTQVPAPPGYTPEGTADNEGVLARFAELLADADGIRPAGFTTSPHLHNRYRQEALDLLFARRSGPPPPRTSAPQPCTLLERFHAGQLPVEAYLKLVAAAHPGRPPRHALRQPAAALARSA